MVLARVNPAEQLIAVFQGRKPEVVPWFADLSWWHFAQCHNNSIPEEYQGDQGLVRLHQHLHCGIYLPLVSPWDRQFDCPFKKQEVNKSIITIFQTPVGELREVFRYIEGSWTWHYEERLLKSADDLRALHYVLASQFYEPMINRARDKQRQYGSQGVPTLCLPRSPLSRLVVELAGIETTVSIFVERPEELKALVQLLAKIDEPAHEIVSQAEGKLVMFPDNLSSEIISPQLFTMFTMDFYKVSIQELKRAGKFCLTHIDGAMRGLLPLLSQTGLDGLEGLTPAPFGDLKPEELRSHTRPQIILWGGLPGPIFTRQWGQTAFEDYVISYIQSMKDNYRFVLGVGDQVPPDADIERVRRVSELVEQFGQLK